MTWVGYSFRPSERKAGFSKNSRNDSMSRSQPTLGRSGIMCATTCARAARLGAARRRPASSPGAPGPRGARLEAGVLGEPEAGAYGGDGVPAVGVARDVLVRALQADLQPRAAVRQHLRRAARPSARRARPRHAGRGATRAGGCASSPAQPVLLLRIRRAPTWVRCGVRQ